MGKAGSRSVCEAENLLVHSFLQRLAGGELDHLGSGDHAFFARAGIAALAFAAVDDLEAAETGEGNLFAVGDAFGQNADSGIQELLGGGFGAHSDLGMNFIDNICLRHGKTPSLNWSCVPVLTPSRTRCHRDIFPYPG